MKPETAWKWMPGVVLGATLVFGVWRVMVAVNDPHFGVVENAYEQGGQWDAHRAEVLASQALGWQVKLTPGSSQAQGDRENMLRIVGPDGASVEGVHGEVVAFHNGYPKQLYRANITATAPGQYTFAMPLPLAGKWRWQFRFQRGEDLWIGQQRVSVVAGGLQ
jgi:nitrogen fixation protein FixH